MYAKLTPIDDREPNQDTKTSRLQTKDTAKKLYLLQGLPGIGPERAKQLLEQFGSVKNIFIASEEELAKRPHIGKIAAQKIINIIQREF